MFWLLRYRSDKGKCHERWKAQTFKYTNYKRRKLKLTISSPFYESLACFLAKISPNWHLKTTVFYGVGFLTPCPTTNLEDQGFKSGYTPLVGLAHAYRAPCHLLGDTLHLAPLLRPAWLVWTCWYIHYCWHSPQLSWSTQSFPHDLMWSFIYICCPTGGISILAFLINIWKSV